MRARLGLALALLVGVGSLQASAAAAESPYIGSWTAHLSRVQMIDKGFDVRLAGTFRLVLRPGGTYRTFNSFDKASHGRFTVSGRTIAFRNDVRCNLGGFRGSGLYTWMLEDGQLRLTQPRAGSDPCGGRWQTLTYPIWTKA